MAKIVEKSQKKCQKMAKMAKNGKKQNIFIKSLIKCTQP